MPVFGKINMIALIDSNVIFLITLLQTVEYVKYMGGYRLRLLDSVLHIKNLRDLVELWPMDCYELGNGDKFVSPKYSIESIVI